MAIYHKGKLVKDTSPVTKAKNKLAKRKSNSKKYKTESKSAISASKKRLAERPYGTGEFEHLQSLKGSKKIIKSAGRLLKNIAKDDLKKAKKEKKAKDSINKIVFVK